MASHSNPASGRVVVLTGAAGGIGKVITRALLTDGHCVAAVDRDTVALERLSASLHGARRLHPIVADLGSENDCQEAVEVAAARFGRVEAVITMPHRCQLASARR